MSYQSSYGKLILFVLYRKSICYIKNDSIKSKTAMNRIKNKMLFSFLKKIKMK